MSKFKLYAYVQVSDVDHPWFGKVGIIVNQYSIDTPMFYQVVAGFETGQWFAEEDLAPVEDSLSSVAEDLTANEDNNKMASAKTKKFKPGDEVEFLSYGKGKRIKGTIAGHYSCDTWIVDDDSDSYYLEEHQLTLVPTPDTAPSDRKKIASDGGSTDYYKIPSHATELRHLISHKGMSKSRGDIMKAVYRLGEKAGVDVGYDLNKLKFFVDDLIEMHARGEHL